MTFEYLPIPLLKSLDLSADPATGSDVLDTAENCDLTHDGVVRGRPGRTDAQNFITRLVGTDVLTPVYSSPGSFASTGFVSQGLHSVRNRNGVLPYLSTAGRLFARDGTRWIDKGPAACFKVGRTNYKVDQSNAVSNRRDATAQDFGRDGTPGQALGFHLDAPSGDLDRLAPFTGIGTDDLSGNSARSGTTTAIVVVSSSNVLRFIYRTASGDTLTAATLATDARQPGTELGDSPSICCSGNATVFWVAYRTTTANQYKVLRVGLTGTVLATFTSTLTGLQGIWVDNTDSGTDRLIVGLTNASGLTLKTLLATAMTDNATDSTVAVTNGKEVVVGRDTNSRFWWAYRADQGNNGDLLIGTCTVGTAGSAVVAQQFHSSLAGAGNNSASARWVICHQPINVGGRCYITLGASVGTDAGTWFTIDLSNWWFDPVASVGPFTAQPAPVARGPANALITSLHQPASATILSDGSGWTFATLEYTRFFVSASTAIGFVTGEQNSVTMGRNRITFSQPRAAQIGESTVFSGSVPYETTGGSSCAPMGFPFLAGQPGIDAQAAAGGSMASGDYQIAACWTWTDEAGQVHRSAPSNQRTVTIGVAGNNTLKVYVINPWFHGREFGQVKLELYTSVAGGTSLFLQSTAVPDFFNDYVIFTLTLTPLGSGTPLYTAGGVFPNVHVTGDGGVAAVGRRLWLATGNRLWASKLPNFGEGVAFSDQEPLGPILPAGVGRVMALEGVDSRLLVFCERGIFAIQDGGPDNTGLGPDFTVDRVSDLGCAGPRATTPLESGAVFIAPPSTTDPNAGGPWLVDGGRVVKYLGRALAGRASRTYGLAPTAPVDVAYNPERQQLFITVAGTTNGLAVLDMRIGRWCTWTAPSGNPLPLITTVKGVLWSTEGTAGPRPYDRTDGTDNSDGNVTMKLTTSHLPSTGQLGLAWSRVRSVRILGTRDSGAHSLTMQAYLDERILASNVGYPTPITVPAASDGGVGFWPSSRQAPEWRLPQQKCNTIQVLLTATPAVAEWVTLELAVKRLPNTAPAGLRF